MTGAIEEYAQWEASMYYLEVVSPYGDPYGSGWYSPHSKARFGVSTPVDQGNDTLRVFLRWTGDLQAHQPEAEIVITRPMRVVASWQTQYLVTFNTMLPNRVVLQILGIPETLPQGGEMFGMYYPNGTLITAGPAPAAVEGAQGTRYVFTGWSIDLKPFTAEPSFSLRVDRPHRLGIIYSTEHILTIKAIGVGEPFYASVIILAQSTKVRLIGSISPVQEWFREGTMVRLTISTPNSIGGGQWAIFKQWSEAAQGTQVTVSVPISAPTSIAAIFFVVNPVAQSLPFSILAGAISVLVSHLLADRLKSQARGRSTPVMLGIGVASVALGVASLASTTIASQYQIDHGQLVDLSNWAVLFTGAEAMAFLIGTTALAWRPLVTWKPEIPRIQTNPYGI